MATLVNYTCNSFIKLTPGKVDVGGSRERAPLLVRLRIYWVSRKCLGEKFNYYALFWLEQA